MKKLMTAFMLLSVTLANAQVKIGNNPNTINSNSLLELESTNKGLLPPRVALTSLNAVAPLTGTVPAGMMVYSSGGTVADGYYFWDGAKWATLAQTHIVTKTANATLLKTETFVLASNDITLTLPVVTAADDGLTITIKNIGTHTDEVVIATSGGATNDGVALSKLYRWLSRTFVAYNGNWIRKDKEAKTNNMFDVSSTGSWTSLEEVIEFFELHMAGPSVVRLSAEVFELSSTQVIDLPYPLTIEGISYGATIIEPASGLQNSPMFRCLSECYFKMLVFDATALTNYGTLPGEDAIRFLASGSYNEVKDCSFDRFYNTILDSTDAELWIFETDISNAQRNGILVHGAVAGVVLKVAETDFISCNYGINLSKGSAATIQLASGGYYNANSGDTAIFYQPTTFTGYTSISITGNSWNNVGKYIEGFDFTRSDGRDANVIMESNAGVGSAHPSCHITVLNNATATNTTSTSTWYKANWTNTSSTTIKWTIGNNKITYQPNNRRNGWIIISGNLLSSSSTAVINIGIVKNGVSGTRYGETTLRITSANSSFQFSTVVYLSDIAPGDYFELWLNSNAVSSTTTVQDIQWLVNTQ